MLPPWRVDGGQHNRLKTAGIHSLQPQGPGQLTGHSDCSKPDSSVFSSNLGVSPYFNKFSSCLC